MIIIYSKNKLHQLLKIAQGRRSLNEYARSTGVSAGYISKLMRGLNKQAPSPQILEKLANESVGVTYADLMEACGHIVPIELDDNSSLIKHLYTSTVASSIVKETEQHLIKLFSTFAEDELKQFNRLLDKLDKNDLLDLTSFYSLNESFQKVKAYYNPIPVISDTLNSSDLFLAENIIAYAPASNERAYLYVETTNDSMKPLIEKGSYLTLIEARELEHNKYFSFIFLEKLEIITRRVVEFKDGFYLFPINSTYESYKYDPDRFKLIGLVDYVTKKRLGQNQS